MTSEIIGSPPTALEEQVESWEKRQYPRSDWGEAESAQTSGFMI